MTTSLAVAEGVGNPHKSVIQLIRLNIGDFEDFGRVAFQMLPFETLGGTQKREVAILNEQQATLLMTYMRNNDVVRAFKKRLVKEFYTLASTAHDDSHLPRNYKEALLELVAKEEQREQLLLENRQKDEEIHDLKNLFKQGMTLPAFCKMLNGVNVNQVNAFFKDRGWLFHDGRDFRVASYARDRYLTENNTEISPHGREPFIRYKVTLLRKGAGRAYDYYRQGMLPMKKDWDGKFSHWKQDNPSDAA